MRSEDSGAREFGGWVRRQRVAAGLSQEDLAERSGLSVRAISDLERGRTTRPYPRTRRLLATALESGHEDKPFVPCQLPAGVSHFTGRTAELDALTGMLGDVSGADTVVISALAGTAGVGKTAVAVHWAHQVAERFPDGQLYVNLRGYDPVQPVAAADALAGFLRALGVPGQEIPEELEDRARLYRSRLVGRRVLVLLDNARDGEHVRPLLPGDPSCFALLTSRDALAGLVAADGARRLDLDVLPLKDAVTLLRSLIGARVDDDPDAAVGLAGLCARLPLALRIAAELAAARPAGTLKDLIAELELSRLDGLDGGEDRADVRAVFSWSVRQLPDYVAGVFALLGLHPGADLDVHAAAALTGTSTAQARKTLDRLHRASLVQRVGAGRYGMHDLLRAFAREQAGVRDTGGLCQRALTWLFDYHLCAAATAMDIVFPADSHQRPRIGPTAMALPEMVAEAQARAWLDAERANLVAVVVYCAGHGWPEHTASLAATLYRYLMQGSHLPEAQTIYGYALHAARWSGDLAAEANALNGLGGIAMMRGHLQDAVGHYRTALERYRRCANRTGEARVLGNLGHIEHQLHNQRFAASYYRQSIAAFEDAADRLGAARALADLANTEIELESYDEAGGHLRLALPVLRDAKDQAREAEALTQMGELSLRRGQLTEAADFFEHSLAICLRLDHPAGVANGLRYLGEVSLRCGECQQAISYLRRALALYRQTGYQYGETLALRTLAGALNRAGRPAAAHAELTTALQLAADTGNSYQQASIHRDLAEGLQKAGQDQQARHHWQQALTLYIQLGDPDADEVRAELSRLG
jgi:tetratricopeptide (TPR) repeat protein/DNA-binding XRE family transcriptional regulator